MTNIKHRTGNMFELTRLNQWVCWKMESTKAGGRLEKIPCVPDYPPYSINALNPSNHLSYEEALWAYRTFFEIDGIGFVPSKEDPFCFLDLDRIANAETREVQAWVVRLLEELDSFAYLTPSDNGLRIVIRGILTEGGGRYIYRDKEGDHVLEVYASNQFLTFTHQIWDKPIREAQKWLNNLKKISVFSPRNRLRYEFPEVTLYGDLEDIREEVRMKPYLEICGRMRVKERLCLGY